MSDLPAEVVTDILTRLPVKTLLRFRCVSKPWCALIDSRDFVKFHLKRSIETKSNLSLILRYCYLYSVDLESLDNAVEVDHPLKCDNYETQVLGSCNGLLCLSNSEVDIVVWNPSIRKHRKLPLMQIEFPPGLRGSCFSHFVVYGFGHDVVNDEYKLVRMVQFYGVDLDSFESEVKVCNLKSNSWRRIPDFPYYLLYKQWNGMLVSGALHWVVTRKPESDTANLIAAFDIRTEDYRLVPQPEYSDENFHMNVGVLGGCLSIFCNYYSVRVDIWVMKEYGVKESWTNLFSVSQPTVIRSFEYVGPIAYSKSSEEVLLEQDGERLLWYNLKNKTVKIVRIRGMPNSFSIDICLGSLVPPGGDVISDGKKHPAKEKTKMKKKKSQSGSLSNWKKAERTDIALTLDGHVENQGWMEGKYNLRCTTFVKRYYRS
ncbi:hypothetical protein F0562_017320 [Nyssa sinensis]|uniref:F-box domain-containing protein n=1 Tax=Nyssa sinensis TaxID=561372 RepID=A0A5J4ZGY5_9ASTE|nr:hypothetical protein F0562_017320 [Nyssa sinensis]